MAPKRRQEKRKTGRPTKRDARADATILAALRDGCSLTTAAQCAGISRETLREWRGSDPAFLAACETAAAQARQRMSASLFNRALKGDTTAAIWWQKTRDPESREPKDQPRYLGVDLGVGEIKTAEDVARFAAAVLDAVARGDLDIETAEALNRLVQIAVAQEFAQLKAAGDG